MDREPEVSSLELDFSHSEGGGPHYFLHAPEKQSFSIISAGGDQKPQSMASKENLPPIPPWLFQQL